MAPSKSYHLLYELEVANLDEVLTVEEWASFGSQQMRLDLIAGSQRTSYLTYGASGELFRYKRFECQRLEANDSSFKEFEILSKLFLGFPLVEAANGERVNPTSGQPPAATLAYGLGPLWLRASQASTSVQLRGPNEQESWGLDSEVFEVKLRQDLRADQLEFELRFYFVKTSLERASFIDSLDWVVKLAPAKGKAEQQQEEIEARAKVLHVDWSAFDQSVFKLPVAHGCQRAPRFDQHLELSSGLVLLHMGVPNQVSLEVSTGRPLDSSGKWASRRYSVSLARSARVRSRDDFESFITSLVQERQQTSGKLAKSKQVWWMARESAQEALVYSFDELSGECKVKYREPSELIELKFPSEQDDQEAGGGGGGQLSLSLGAQELTRLFSSTEDYHLIDEGELLGTSGGPSESRKDLFRDRLYEKRVQSFTLRSQINGAPTVAWRGPVSLVKRISSHARHLSQLERAKVVSAKTNSGSANRTGAQQQQLMVLADDYRTTLVIYFFSPADQQQQQQSQLIMKATLDLVANHEIDYAYMHQQLDVSSCYATGEQNNNNNREIRVRYPLEWPQAASRQLAGKRQQLVGQTYVNLFEQPESFLSPLEVARMQVSLDNLYLYLQMTLVDLPLSHLFERRKGVRLAASEAEGPSVLEATSPSALRCGQFCEHYNCFRFAYDSSELLCQLELLGGDGRRLGAQVVPKATSELYEFVERNRTRLSLMDNFVRSHYGPQKLMEILDQFTLSELEAGGEQQAGLYNPLKLALIVPSVAPESALNSTGVTQLDSGAPGQQTNRLLLVPSSIERQFDPIKLANNYQQQQQQQQATSIRPDYVILAPDRKLNGDFGRTLRAANYEQCAQLCALSNCRSFSHCQHDESCQLSDAHLEAYLMGYSKATPLQLGCKLYSLDSMSQFELWAARAPRPPATGSKLDSSKLRPNVAVASKSARDCSSACLDEQKFVCQAFYWCPSAGSLPTGCFMSEQHVDSMQRSEASEQLIGSSESSSPRLASKAVCEFYSRSYLTKFTKILGKKFSPTTSINNNNNQQTGQQATGETLDGLSLDTCARRCLESNCLAFSVGPAKLGGLGLQQTCLLIGKQFSQENLLPQAEWTTFVLARSVSSTSQGGEPGGSAKQAQDMESGAIDLLLSMGDRSSSSGGGGGAGQRATSGGWLAKMGSFLAGLALGSCFILLYDEAYSRAWFERLAAAFGQFGARRE